jgi:protein TonB
VVLLLVFGRGGIEKVDIEVKIIENPKVAQAQVDLSKQPPPAPKEPPARKVFGASKKSITTDDASAGLDIKTGNTVATAPDNENLKDSDAESLPIPTDEYLLSRPPQVIGDVRPVYPPEAKAKNIEGSVKVEILIDAQGVVREARILSGLGYGTDESALDAARKLRFRPAEASGKPVAVRVPFTVNFRLDK